MNIDHKEHMFTALCTWEHILELCDISKDSYSGTWGAIADSLGYNALRDKSADFAAFVHRVYVYCVTRNKDIFDAMSFDWEVVPLIINECRNEDGTPNINLGDNSDIHPVAMRVMARLQADSAPVDGKPVYKITLKRTLFEYQEAVVRLHADSIDHAVTLAAEMYQDESLTFEKDWSTEATETSEPAITAELEF